MTMVKTTLAKKYPGKSVGLKLGWNQVADEAGKAVVVGIVSSVTTYAIHEAIHLDKNSTSSTKKRRT